MRSGGIVLAFLGLCFIAKMILIPIFLALFLAMLVEPLIGLGLRANLSRMTSTTLIVLILAGVSAVGGWLLYTAALEVVGAMPTYIEKIDTLMRSAGSLSEKVSPSLAASGEAQGGITGGGFASFDWSSYAFAHVENAATGLTLTLFVPLLMFYMLLDKENLIESFNVINGQYFNLPKLNLELPRMLRIFFVANLVTGVFLVMAQALALGLLGFQNWISLALLTGFLNLLPVVGGAAAFVAAILFGLGVTLSWPLVSILAAVMLGLHFLSNNLIVPQLVGAKLNINTVALIIGLLFWSWMWGAAGFLLAVPMTALVKILLECHRDTYAFANLMASKPKRLIPGQRSQ